EDPARGATGAHVPQGEPAGLIPMPAAKYVRPTVWVPPTTSAVLQPQPPLAPSIPPMHIVDLMTEAGAAAVGARGRGEEGEDAGGGQARGEIAGHQRHATPGPRPRAAPPGVARCFPPPISASGAAAAWCRSSGSEPP